MSPWTDTYTHKQKSLSRKLQVSSHNTISSYKVFLIFTNETFIQKLPFPLYYKIASQGDCISVPRGHQFSLKPWRKQSMPSPQSPFTRSRSPFYLFKTTAAPSKNQKHQPKYPHYFCFYTRATYWLCQNNNLSHESPAKQFPWWLHPSHPPASCPSCICQILGRGRAANKTD